MEMKARQELTEAKLEGDGEGENGGEVDDVLAAAGTGKSAEGSDLEDTSDDSSTEGEGSGTPEAGGLPSVQADQSENAAISAEVDKADDSGLAGVQARIRR